jgi:hypothetical protein
MATGLAFTIGMVLTIMGAIVSTIGAFIFANVLFTFLAIILDIAVVAEIVGIVLLCRAIDKF